MRIELVDPSDNKPHICESNSPELIALWLKEWLPVAATSQAPMPPWQIYIWPSTPDEYETIKQFKPDMNGGIFKVALPEQMAEISLLFKAFSDYLKEKENE